MNSSIEVSEAVTLAQKLIQRTMDGKLSWEADDVENLAFVPNRFTTVLEGNLRARVSCTVNGDLDFSLVELDNAAPVSGVIAYDKSPTPPARLPRVGNYSEKEVLRVSVEKDPAYGFDTPEEKQLAGLLVDLHGLARRSALRVAGSVERALTYLDKIAS
jgi:hypothetical protein